MLIVKNRPQIIDPLILVVQTTHSDSSPIDTFRLDFLDPETRDVVKEGASLGSLDDTDLAVKIEEQLNTDLGLRVSEIHNLHFPKNVTQLYEGTDGFLIE